MENIQEKKSIIEMVSEENKGNKKSASKRAQEYSVNYRKRNYIMNNITLSYEYSIKLIAQAEFKGCSRSQHIRDLLDKEEENLSPEYQQLYQNMLKRFEANKEDDFCGEIVRKLAEEDNQRTLDDFIKNATEFFGKDPLLVSKGTRADYIIEVIDSYPQRKARLFCETLQISRVTYHTARRQKPLTAEEKEIVDNFTIKAEKYFDNNTFEKSKHERAEYIREFAKTESKERIKLYCRALDLRYSLLEYY